MIQPSFHRLFQASFILFTISPLILGLISATPVAARSAGPAQTAAWRSDSLLQAGATPTPTAAPSAEKTPLTPQFPWLGVIGLVIIVAAITAARVLPKRKSR